jgi:hypothetical protein
MNYATIRGFQWIPAVQKLIDSEKISGSDTGGYESSLSLSLSREHSYLCITYNHKRAHISVPPAQIIASYFTNENIAWYKIYLQSTSLLIAVGIHTGCQLRTDTSGREKLHPI